jgi:WD40 repeat protein
MDTPIRTFPEQSAVHSIAAANNIALVGFTPYEGNPPSARIWNLSTGQSLQALSAPLGSPVVSVALSPNGQYAAATTAGLKALLWDTNSGRLLGSVPTPGSDQSSRIAFSPDGQLILSSLSSDLTVFDLTLRQKNKITAVKPGTTTTAIASSPEGRFMAAGYAAAGAVLESDVSIYDLLTGQMTLQFLSNKGPGVSCLAWTGSYILTGSSNKTIKLWNAQSGAAVSRPFPTHAGTVNALAVSSDGRLVLSGSADATMKVIEFSTGKELHSFTHTDGPVTAVAFAFTGTPQLAVSCSGSSAKLWDLTGF